MSSIQRLEKVNIDGVTAKPPRAMGKAKLVFLEPLLRVSTPKLTQQWPIRPASDENPDKFTLEVRLDAEQEAFKSALTAFDLRVRKLAFENKKSWLGKAADDVEAEADLRQMQSMSIKKGNEKPDGSRYDDTVKFKITGWGDYVDEILYKGEGDNKYPTDVKWRSRLVDPQGNGGPSDAQTKFYICENKDMTTGKEQMAPWTPCQDPAGNPIRDAHGNIVWEFVGPKHCQPGCKLTIVYQPTMVWLAASKFGVTMTAKQVFITPAPPKSKPIVEGIEIVDSVDPIMAGRAARQAMASDDARDLEVPPDHDDNVEQADAAPADGHAESHAEAAPESAAAADASATIGKKRKATDAGESPAARKSKKSKIVTVEEDF